MIDPAKNPNEFEQRVRTSPDIARLETEDNPQNMYTKNALYYRAYVSSDIAYKMKQAEDPFDVIESISRRIRNLGAHEITVDGAELVIAYKHDE